MSKKLVDLNGEQAVFIRWQTRKPQTGDHMTVYSGTNGQPGRQAERRLILQECVRRQPGEIDKNMTEEWWSFIEVSESEFQKMRTYINKNESIAKTHDTLF